ncbi:MAG: hypothetical protein IT538_08245 [Variibacter sp.]|nr:hypothetical protein [Variibacter sp.]
MELRLPENFDEYVEHAGETARILISGNNASVRGLRMFHIYFRTTLWSDRANISPISSLLKMNSYMLFLAGAHSALQGHVAAIFPVFRTALENACYAFLIAKDPTLADIWINRHRDDASRRASRAKFTSAVQLTASALNEIQPKSGNIVQQLYEASIDFGAHPNPRGVFEYLSVGKADEKGQIALSLTALHGPNDFDTRRGLIACMDFASTIALVMARSRPMLTQQLAEALIGLNAAKEDAIHEFGLSVSYPILEA